MKYQTIKEAGYKYLSYSNGEHYLRNLDTGEVEVFASSKYHAGFALKYKNTHLEFLRSESRITFLNDGFPKRGAK